MLVALKTAEIGFVERHECWENEMRRISIVLRILAGLAFIGSAAGMLADVDTMARDLQLETWFLTVVSIVKLASGIGLLASIWLSRLALPAGLLFVALMAGAVVTHIRIDDPVSNMAAPAVLLLLSAAIAAISFWEDLELRSSVAQRIAVSPDYGDRSQTNV